MAGQAHSIRAAISIHALREEGDFADCEGELLQDEFLSTPSARRATFTFQTFQQAQQISIHALREEGDRQTNSRTSWMQKISIHALREEGDRFFFFGKIDIRISIHALREEGDPKVQKGHTEAEIFLSTPSARRATSVAPG